METYITYTIIHSNGLYYLKIAYHNDQSYLRLQEIQIAQEQKAQELQDMKATRHEMHKSMLVLTPNAREG